MSILYAYLAILLFMLALTYRGINIAITYAPKKIKILSISALVMALIRGLTLLILFFSQNVVFLYLLKPFAFLNLLYIPIIAIVCLYIFIRSDKINFSYFFILCGILTTIYVLILCFTPAAIQGLISYGYSMILVENFYIWFGFVAINTLSLIFCVLTFGKPIVNNLGIFLMIISSTICIADVLLSMIGVEYLAQNIVGELMCIITINYAQSTFKS